MTDRAGHDFRYGMSSSKVADLGWSPQRPFEDALAETVAWYREHRAWVGARLAGVGSVG